MASIASAVRMADFLHVVTSLMGMLDAAAVSLRQEKAAFTVVKEDVDLLWKQCESRQALDIGGVVFATTIPTLRRHGDHLLSVMAAGVFAPEAADDEPFFLDRDPAAFPLVLTYLREGRAPMPFHPIQRSALSRELRYYGLPPLRNLCSLLVISDASVTAQYNPTDRSWLRRGTLAPRVLGACTHEARTFVVADAPTPGARTLQLLELDPVTWLTQGIVEITLLNPADRRYVVLMVGLGNRLFLIVDWLGLLCFDLQSRRWIPCAPMPFAACRLFAVGGALYATDFMGKMFIAESDTRWRLLPRAITMDNMSSLVSWCGHIVAAGNSRSSKTVQMYNPVTQEWTPLPDMLQGRAMCAMAAADDCLFVVGGKVDGVWSNRATIERYDPRRSCWEDLGDCPWGVNDPANLALPIYP